MDNQTRFNRLKIFYKNAPTIAGPWINKQISSLNSQLESLRIKYKEAESKETKDEILSQANYLKEEIKLYMDTKPAGPPVQTPTEKVQADGGSKDSSG